MRNAGPTMAGGRSRRASGRTLVRSLARPSTKMVKACFAPRVWDLGFWFSFALHSRKEKLNTKQGYATFRSLALCCVRATVNIDLQRETEEKARQPETKLGKKSAIAQTCHRARLRDAKRSRTRNPKPTHGARDRSKQPQPRAGRDRASEPGWRHASRRTRPTDTGTRCPGKGQR
jgi:hypothetical protein